MCSTLRASGLGFACARWRSLFRNQLRRESCTQYGERCARAYHQICYDNINNKYDFVNESRSRFVAVLPVFVADKPLMVVYRTTRSPLTGGARTLLLLLYFLGDNDRG